MQSLAHILHLGLHVTSGLRQNHKNAVSRRNTPFNVETVVTTCARLSWPLGFWIHVKLYFRIVCYATACWRNLCSQCELANRCEVNPEWLGLPLPAT